MKLWTSLTGLIQAKLLTADPAGALCAIADAGRRRPVAAPPRGGEGRRAIRLRGHDAARAAKSGAKRS